MIIYYETNGRIVRWCSAEEAPDTSLERLEVAGIIDPSGHYVSNSELVSMGAQPSPAHYFDYDEKAWALDPDALKETYRQAVQSHIDATARARDYDSGVSLASYVGDPNATWASEAAAFVAWRSSVWLFVFDWLSEIDAGTQAPPESAEALVAELPEITWPEEVAE